MKISVVIPCYNEKATIEKVVTAVRASPLQLSEVIVIDDASNDGTADLLKEKVARLVRR